MADTLLEHPKKRLTGRWPMRLAVVVGALVVCAMVASWAISPALSKLARAHIIQVLQKHFGADVQLRRLDVSVFPAIRIHGEGLTFRQRGMGPDAPLLITIGELSAGTSIWAALRSPPRVHQVWFDGLEIQISRRAQRTPRKEKPPGEAVPNFVLENVSADGTKLIVIPKDERKQPLEFDLRKLRLWSAGTEGPMSFQASLTNPKPPGDIQTTGHFGPWNREDPGHTAVDGAYTFRDADLGVFRGIAGKLASDGNYRGVLDRIEVDGTTDVPDFSVRLGGAPVRLKTQFHAIVDGGNGDTALQPVRAQFGNSQLIAKGGVEGEKGVPGKTVTLDVTASGRIEDMLRFGVKGAQPPMKGAVRFQARLVIPPGKEEIARKLHLAGWLGIDCARFTTLGIQEKVNALSQKAKGEPEATGEGTTVSDFAGSFVLDHGQIGLRDFSFRIPGALLNLNGQYGLFDERLDFHGIVRLDAKVSQMTTGWKSVLLKVVDPFFAKKGAGAVIPIKITGTREQPAFGLDLHRQAR